MGTGHMDYLDELQLLTDAAHKDGKVDLRVAVRRVSAMVDDLRHQRNTLAGAIVKAAEDAGICTPQLCLTGPEILLLLADLVSSRNKACAVSAACKGLVGTWRAEGTENGKIPLGATVEAGFVMELRLTIQKAEESAQ